MPRPPIRRTKPITPIAFNRITKTFEGFSVMSDDGNNVTITAHWLIPREDGTIDRATNEVVADDIMNLPGFDAIVDAIAAEA